ncbi:hypothetical protein BG004_002069 [Podila humilis]|nr:hypothetical protein BG004_002069 [Podila humilis]
MDDPLPSIQHSHHNNNSKDNDNAPELIPTEDQDPPQTSKCFTLACIVVFVALVANSIPTLLSPQPRTNPRSSSSSSLSKRTGPSESSPGRILASAFAQHQHPSRQQPLQQQQQQQQQQQPNQQAEFDAIGGSLVYTTDDPSVASSSFNTFRDKQRQVDRLSPKESSRTHPSQHQQHQQHQQREPLIEKTTISELVLIVVNVLVRVAWWSILLLYRACRYLVLGPAGIIMSLLDTPISMMREIYKTVMPVYSFFTVAAVIGVVVGETTPSTTVAAKTAYNVLDFDSVQ